MTLTPGTPLTAEAAMSEVQVLLASLNDADDEYRIQESDDFPLGVVRALTARIAELEAERAKDREALERIDRNKNASGDQIEVIKRIARARLSTPAQQPSAVGEGYIPKHCDGEFCLCGKPAVRKIEERVFDDDPHPIRHNLTAYVCAEHFAMVLGTTAAKSVGLPSGAGLALTDHAALTARIAELEARAGEAAEYLCRLEGALLSDDLDMKLDFPNEPSPTAMAERLLPGFDSIAYDAARARLSTPAPVAAEPEAVAPDLDGAVERVAAVNHHAATATDPLVSMLRNVSERLSRTPPDVHGARVGLDAARLAVSIYALKETRP